MSYFIYNNESYQSEVSFHIGRADLAKTEWGDANCREVLGRKFKYLKGNIDVLVIRRYLVKQDIIDKINELAGSKLKLTHDKDQHNINVSIIELDPMFLKETWIFQLLCHLLYHKCGSFENQLKGLQKGQYRIPEERIPFVLKSLKKYKPKVFEQTDPLSYLGLDKRCMEYPSQTWEEWLAKSVNTLSPLIKEAYELR